MYIKLNRIGLNDVFVRKDLQAQVYHSTILYSMGLWSRTQIGKYLIGQHVRLCILS